MPNSSPTPGQRQRVMLGILAVLLLSCAAAALLFLKKMPLPVRLFIAFGDIILAAALFLLMRKDPLRPR